MSGTGDSSRFSRLGLSGTEIIDEYQNIIVEVLLYLEVVAKTVKNVTFEHYVNFFGIYWIRNQPGVLSSMYYSDAAR